METVVPVELMNDGRVVRRLKDSIVAIKMQQEPPSLKYRGGLELLGLVEFTNACESERGGVTLVVNGTNGTGGDACRLNGTSDPQLR